MLRVNHTDINKLAKEMEDIEEENQRLRASNNQLNYET